ncbi:MAG: MFS transporter [Deltaproteobacteria bacterium]|nr:MAG: MFS transporter [Deltaproteobacteria bacterium]TMA70922.1 MAG: MFS transporter [Deltaproteobacteria bacterium]TMB43855.1 MAG: MFS transporter [Deltaproteobacteria bacterium]
MIEASLGPTRFPRDFWLYLASRFCTATASMLLRAAVAWHVYALSRSAFHLGLIGIVQFLPVLPLTLVAGALADAHDRRRIMMIAQLVSLGCSMALWLATRGGAASLPLLYGMILLVAAAAAFDNPARASLLPGLVGRDAFPRAVTLAATNQALAFATGPAVAGLLIGAAGVGMAYALDAALTAVSLAALTLFRSPAPEGARVRIRLQAIRDGLAFVWRSEVILGCMTVDMFAVIFGGASALLPIYATAILHVGARGYGLLASSFELGALVASAALVARRPITRAGPALLVAVALYGIATIAFGLSRWFPLSVVAYAAAGMADQVSVVLRNTAIQLSTPDALRGRVSAVNMIFIGASNQLGAAESGFVAALTSATFSVVSGGLGCLAVVAIVAARLPRLRRYRTDEPLSGPR